MECTEPSKTSWQTRISSHGHSCGITTAGNLIGASFWGWLVALHKAKWYPCKYSNNYKFSWNTQTFFLLKSIKRQEIQFLTFLNLYFLSQTILLSILVDEVCLAVSPWQGTVVQEPLAPLQSGPTGEPALRTYLWPRELSTANHQWEENVGSWASHFRATRLGQLRKGGQGLLLSLWLTSWLQIQCKSC